MTLYNAANMQILNRFSRETKLFIGLVLLYAALAFILPASKAAMLLYQFTDAQYQSLIFVVRLPFIVTVIAAFYSYRCLVHYVERIRDTKEGLAFSKITQGLRWIAWGLLVPATVSTLLNAIANQKPDFLMFALIITNYMYVVVSLFAFSHIVGGAHRLVQQARLLFSIRHIRVLIMVLVTIGVLFCYLISQRLHGGITNSYNAYYLQNWAVWATIVVPFLYAWIVGLFAALELALVARRTSGIIYKQALQWLALGIVLIIIAMCSLQYYRSVIPRSGTLKIGPSLITAYAIYGVNITGSALLAVGARRLKRIEDI
jgi:hypothetical protein